MASWRRFKMEKNFPEITGRKIVAYFNFDTANNSELVVKVALSAVSTEGPLRICVPRLPERVSNSWRKLLVQIGIVNWSISRSKVRPIRKQCSILLFTTP